MRAPYRTGPKTISSYVHTNVERTYVECDPRPGNYYVSVIDQGRRALLAGPWPTHAEALAQVDAVRVKACELDPRGCWYAFGTARLPDDDSVPIRYGSLNKHLNLPH